MSNLVLSNMLPKSLRASHCMSGVLTVALGVVLGLAAPSAVQADVRQDGVECLRAWEARDLDRAIAACTRVIDSRQISGEILGTTYWLRGNAYRAKGDLDHALADYTRSISLKPGEFSTYVNRGIIYSIKQDFDKAIADFTEAIRLKGDEAFPYYNRGYVQLQLKQYDRAIDDFTRALALKKDYAFAYYHRAECYGRGKRFVDAERDYSDAIRYNIGYTDAYTSRGLVREILSDIAGAIESYKLAISGPPNGPRGPAAQDKARERLAALEKK